MTTVIHDDPWAAALDELEVTLAVAERLIAGDGDDEVPPWSPPVLPVPIPPRHVRRAQRLLARQRELISRAAVARVGVRRKVELLDRLTGSGGAPARTPVYVDVSA